MPIFDQGYQHWTGELSGHAWRWLAITRQGVRIGMKSWFLRLMLIVSWLPALVLAFVIAVWGLVEQKSPIVQPLLLLFSFLGDQMINDPKSYRMEAWTICFSTFLWAETYLSMIVILFVGPSLISQDIRFNALPLYFSRPLRRIDYFAGKLGVIGVFLGMIMIVPSILAYVLGLLFSLDVSILVDTLPLLMACIAYGAIMTFSAGIVILALSSLSRNSRYVGLFWVGLVLLTFVVGATLQLIHAVQRAQEMELGAKMKESQELDDSKMEPSTKEKPRDSEAQGKRKNERTQRVQKEESKNIDDFRKTLFEDSKTDWRPCVSYIDNLSRVRHAMCGVDASWRRLSMNVPEKRREMYLIENMGPQYPWQWSAALLIVFFGISICILNFRVRSLDRLR